MRVSVVGPGGVGGHVGARPAAGADVGLVARGEHPRALQHHGLSVDSAHGDVHVEVAAVADAAEIRPLRGLLRQGLRHRRRGRPPPPAAVRAGHAVNSLQNGVGKEPASLRSSACVTCWVGWPRASPPSPDRGVVAHPGGPARLVVGELDGRHRLADCHRWCTAAGVEAEVTEGRNWSPCESARSPCRGVRVAPRPQGLGSA